jgi:hypothetical protein
MRLLFSRSFTTDGSTEILPTGSEGSRRRRSQAFHRCRNGPQFGNYQMAAGTNTTHRQPEWPPQVAIAKNRSTTRRKQPPSMRHDRHCVRQEEERVLYAAAMLQQRRGLRVHTVTHFGYGLSAVRARTRPASVAEFSCNSSHPQRPHPTFNLARMKTGASRNWRRRYETRSIVPLLSPSQRDFADSSCSDSYPIPNTPDQCGVHLPPERIVFHAPICQSTIGLLLSLGLFCAGFSSYYSAKYD